ncbi:MAG: hypothetical protein ABL901_02945 [Hyphomicrobiaceae bacterium]|nr:hypothetical protein [Hyphomicrobiaceae bacterium]
MFTDAEKVKLRRFMGYPAYGEGNNQFQSWRYFTSYGTLEFKFNHMTADEEAETRSFLTRIQTLYDDIFGARANMDTASAAIWTRNPIEVAERRALYDMQRSELCNFLGQPRGPHFGGRSYNTQIVI